MKSINKLIDLCFLTRPIILVPVWGFCAFGLHIPKNSLLLGLTVKEALLIMAFSMSYAAVYVINQMADYEVDKSNRGFPLLVKSDISMKEAGITAFLLSLTSISVPLALKNPQIALLSTIGVILGMIYSCKPFSFSGRPFLDFLTNAVFAFMAVAAGWCAHGGILNDPQLFVSALPYFLLMCAGSISSTLPDMLGDKNHNKVTTPVFLGAKKANLLATLCIILAAVSSGLLSDQLAFWCAAMATPFYILYILYPSSMTMELTYKAGGALTMMAAGLVIPVLFPLGLLVFFATWLYFRKRHNVAYPSLVADGS